MVLTHVPLTTDEDRVSHRKIAIMIAERAAEIAARAEVTNEDVDLLELDIEELRLRTRGAAV